MRDGRARTGSAVALEDFREAEVQELDAPVGRDFDVGGLEVAVDDPLLVRRLERLGDLLRVGERFFEGERAGSEVLREVFALDELHDEKVAPGNFFEGVDGGDSRMIQRCKRASLPLEPLPSLFIIKEFFRQDLDCDLSREPRVFRPVDLPHSARAERGENLVRTEAHARRECHELNRF